MSRETIHSATHFAHDTGKIGGIQRCLKMRDIIYIVNHQFQEIQIILKIYILSLALLTG